MRGRGHEFKPRLVQRIFFGVYVEWVMVLWYLDRMVYSIRSGTRDGQWDDWAAGK